MSARSQRFRVQFKKLVIDSSMEQWFFCFWLYEARLHQNMNVIVLPKNQNMKFIYAFIHKNQRSNMTWWVNTNSTSNIMYVAYTMANKYVILIPPL